MPGDDCASNPHPRGAGPADHRHPGRRGVLHRLALVQGSRLRAGLPALADRPDAASPSSPASSCSRCSPATCCSRCASLRPRPFMIATPQGPQTIMMDPREHPAARAAGAAASSRCSSAIYAGGQWETWLYFLNATPFGKPDPILGRDIGFYVFTLPLLEMLQGLLLLRRLPDGGGGGRRLRPRRRGRARPDARALRVAPRDAASRACSPRLLLLVLAFGAWLQIPQLLTTPSGVVAGATYIDVHARMPALRVLIGAAVLGALLAVWQAFTARPAVADSPRPPALRPRRRSAAAPMPRSSSASSSRRTSRCGRRRSSSTTSRRRARRSASTASPSGRCRERRT